MKIKFSLIAVLLGSFLTMTYEQSQKNRDPNFIVILTDDQGWAGTNVPMDPTVEKSSGQYFVTPNFGRLADMGVRFSQGYSSAPKCAPARAGLLT